MGSRMTISADTARRVALVTGGSRGIGAAIALRLAADGFDVAINYRRQEEAANGVAATAEARGVRALAYRADIASYEEDAAMIDRDEPARLLGVHAVGAHHLASLALPHLRRHDRSDVLLVSSTAAARPTPNGAPYMMAKVALEALGRTLALEEGDNGVRVNIVAPGLTVTDMGDRLAHAVTGAPGAAALDAATPFGRVTRPDDVAAVVAFLVSPDSAMVTGQRIEVTSGTPLPGRPEEGH